MTKESRTTESRMTKGDTSRPPRHCSFRHSGFLGHWWVIGGAFVIFCLPGAVWAHPGLDLAHDRTAAVKLTPQGVRVEYRLEVHVTTAVRLEVLKLVEDLTTLRTTQDYF